MNVAGIISENHVFKGNKIGSCGSDWESTSDAVVRKALFEMTFGPILEK